MLAPEQVCFFGYTIEDAALGAISSRRFGAAQVARDPRAAAQQALAVLTAAADVPLHNQGLTLADAMTALTVLFNPDHGDPDGSTARILATAIAAAPTPLIDT